MPEERGPSGAFACQQTVSSGWRLPKLRADLGRWVREEDHDRAPDALFPKAKAPAAERGQSLNRFFTEAVWEAALGVLPSWHRENSRIDLRIAAEFETVDNER